MNTSVIEKITCNPRLLPAIERAASGSIECSDLRLMDVVDSYSEVKKYFFACSHNPDGEATKKQIGPWISALLKMRAKKWAERGTAEVQIQIVKARKRKLDPDYMQLFDDVYYDALLEERKKLGEA